MKCLECGEQLLVFYPDRAVLCHFCRYITYFDQHYRVLDVRPGFTVEEARENLKNTSVQEVCCVMSPLRVTDGKCRRIIK